MKGLNALKLRIMIRAFEIRITNGETFENISADYPAITQDDLETIRDSMNIEEKTPDSGEVTE